MAGLGETGECVETEALLLRGFKILPFSTSTTTTITTTSINSRYELHNEQVNKI
jgi:hypothetical protein